MTAETTPFTVLAWSDPTTGGFGLGANPPNAPQHPTAPAAAQLAKHSSTDAASTEIFLYAEALKMQQRQSKIPERRGGCRCGTIAAGLMVTTVGPTLNVRPVPADQPSRLLHVLLELQCSNTWLPTYLNELQCGLLLRQWVHYIGHFPAEVVT